ncbi:MAG: FAD-dependent oxidoreductase [Arcanobacterium sp.]|nr:FAD-dependent oxidoreductase [Arcanobacterium sp.]
MIGIIGGGLAGLTMAKELAEAGAEVSLFEERSNLGGLIPQGFLGGVYVDFGADAYTRRDPNVTSYIESLGLTTLLPNGRSWIFDGEAFPIPENATVGIPADPFNPDIMSLLRDPQRVAQDLELPASVGAESATLGQLVRARMGNELVDKVVAPIVSAIYSTHPDNLALDPVIAENFKKFGTLSAAVKAGLHGPAIASVVGGMSRLPLRLAELAQEAGAQIHTGARVRAIRPGEIDVEIAGRQRTVRVEEIVVATGVARALDLLPGVMHCEPIALPSGRLTTHVNLVLNAPALREAPRGSGLLTAQGAARAKALSHMSHKWPWLREVSDYEFLRVSYAVNEQIPVEQALVDASQLLDVPLNSTQLVDSYVLRWGGALTPSTPELRRWARALTPPPGVSVVGVWRAGSGISAVLPHALAEADRILGR